MKKQLIIIGIAVAGLLAATAANDASAGIFNKKDKTVKKAPKDKVVHVSGSFSGEIKDRFKFQGRKIVVTKETIFRGNDYGEPVKKGSHISGSHVYITGVLKDGAVRASMIIVAPPGQEGGKAGELDPGTAR